MLLILVYSRDFLEKNPDTIGEKDDRDRASHAFVIKKAKKINVTERSIRMGLSQEGP